jgi:hypothetical protein
MTKADTPGAAPETDDETAKKKAERKARREAKFLADLRNFDSLPAYGHVDVRVVSRVLHRAVGSIWRDLKSKEKLIPAPVYLGKRMTRWNVGELRDHIEAARNTTRTPWRCPPKKEATQ